ncbi:hypothetical protein JN535_05325 [Cellulosimicrobium cellulans]|uniref:hypothetical protein n=1 Tax=Cellulosimicrobium cellulans TaxID=1710 RepID=UPI001964BCB8|nr:hypothetical protein [Cellulosimicrobium cellulans]MBN0039597.1 hypothetical protein [Cellulosimicrobium cellulans]
MGDVLGRIDDALENVAHVLALGPGGETIGSSGLDAPPVVAIARSIAAALAAAGPEVPGDSARCVLNTSESCVFVYQLGKDLSVILVGPSDWNIALTGRRTEQLLVEFVDAYLEEIATKAPGKDAVELPRRPGDQQGATESRVESRRDRRSRASSPSGDYALLSRVLKALVEL